MTGVLTREQDTITEERPCKDTGEDCHLQAKESQGVRPQKETNPADTLISD